MTKKREERLAILTKTDAPLWEQGIAFAGMDEAGRGPLAGNVVAACVIMPASPLLPWVDDSKKLSPQRRDQVYDEIMETALFVGVGQASPEEIDAINILQATKNAMRRAAENAPASLFLIDAVTGLGLHGEERGIIHGDAVCYSIAAASIIAKVTRDRQMEELDQLYP
ncbi:MAG: ribonuclease HII, partial [Clostridia bacterium]|nr:ribonuclease HII [Clostridia bacterium]